MTVVAPVNGEMVEEYEYPPLSLLKEPAPPPKRIQAELSEKIRILEQTLDEFGIGANVVEIAHGPTVTRYEVQLAPGIKVSKIVSLADNLAMAGGDRRARGSADTGQIRHRRGSAQRQPAHRYPARGDRHR
jgi:DNA segregation ATPase FtsK/SpoIIIE-like protein